MLQYLHEVVEVATRDPQLFPQLVDSLVMQTVDPQALFSGKPGNERARFQQDGLAGQHRAEIGGVLAHPANVQVQGATHHDIDQLIAATDAHQRQPLVKRIPDVGLLQRIPVVVVLLVGKLLGTVQAGMDIVTAADDHGIQMLCRMAPIDVDTDRLRA